MRHKIAIQMDDIKLSTMLMILLMIGLEGQKEIMNYSFITQMIYF